MAAIVIVASSMSYVNGVYQQGLLDGARQIANAQHGSPKYSPAGDKSTMEPYITRICDNSPNLRNAHGYAANGNFSQVRSVVDSYGGGCGAITLPFKGKYHKACSGDNYNCTNWSVH
jgi:hypothetical protein